MGRERRPIPPNSVSSVGLARTWAAVIQGGSIALRLDWLCDEPNQAQTASILRNASSPLRPNTPGLKRSIIRARLLRSRLATVMAVPVA